MLLPFRWLLYGTAAAPAAETTTGTRKHPKIQRKLRRLAQWSEAIAPPRVTVVIEGKGAVLSIAPEIQTGSVVTTRHVAVYSKGVAQAAAALADFIGVDVSIEAEPFAIKSALISGEIETKIDLLEDEYLALMQLLAA